MIDVGIFWCHKPRDLYIEYPCKVVHRITGKEDTLALYVFGGIDEARKLVEYWNNDRGSPWQYSLIASKES